MNAPKIVVVGHVCIDDNTTENATYTSWGSSAIYIANYVRTAYNTTPVILTTYGPDLLKHFPKGISLLPEQPNAYKTLRYENNTRVLPRVWKAHNLEYASPPPLTGEATKVISTADIVFVATLAPNYSPAYIRDLMQHTKPSALKVLCPQGYFRSFDEGGKVAAQEFTSAKDIVPYFDVVIYSDDDHPRAFALGKQWKQFAPKTEIVVTEGPKGASIITATDLQHVPTHPLRPEDIVDSVGCGDTFAATVGYVYHQTQDLILAIREAHKAAAHKLSATPVTK